MTGISLADFLLDRIAEDEAGRPAPWHDDEIWSADRVLAECEAKRRIVAEVEALEVSARAMQDAGVTKEDPNARVIIMGVAMGRTCIALMGTVYAAHPDYREEWKP